MVAKIQYPKHLNLYIFAYNESGRERKSAREREREEKGEFIIGFLSVRLSENVHAYAICKMLTLTMNIVKTK